MCRVVAPIPDVDTSTEVLAADLSISQDLAHIPCSSQYLQANAGLTSGWDGYLPQEDEVESGSTNTADGLSIPFALSEEARRQEKKLLLTPARPWKNTLLSDTLRAVVYRGQTPMDWAERPLLWGGAALSLGLAVAIPKDRANLRIYKHGRRSRGAEEVTAAEF